MLCSICTEHCCEESYTDCGHVFHAECLMKWFETDDSCPNCRKYHPISRQVIEKSNECACGSCTLFFVPDEINIWIHNNIIPLCPHCYVDCVFPNISNFSVDRFKEFIINVNNKSFDSKISLENQVKIKDDIVVIVDDKRIITSFYRSKSFDEYFDL